MKRWNKAGKVWLVLATALLITAGASQSWAGATNTKGEVACHSALAKGIGKHTAAIAKAMATCENAVLAGAPGPCPDMTAQEAIDKSAAKAAKGIVKKCQSSCSISGVSCIGTPFCPPNGATPEGCTAAGKNPFQSANMGFPGALCEDIIGGPMIDPDDFGTCASGLGTTPPNTGGLGGLISAELLSNIYGDLDGTPMLSPDATKCLSAIAAAAPKTISKNASAVAKCRNTQLAADSALLLPNACATGDEKTASSIAKNIAKFNDTIDGSCTAGAITELSLCGNGIGGTTSVSDAKACLDDVLDQTGISVATAETRQYAVVSIINGAYPSSAPPRCGDNRVDQKANQFSFNGEECDGTDDSACPGHCFPPGDTFECTCDTHRRARGLADGFAADLDNGWSGKSHNAKVTDKAGFVTDVSNCNCSAFDPVNKATCIGATSDQVCDLFAEVEPRCSNRIGDHTSCDEVGNHNGTHSDSDCRSCDAFADNAGAYCTGTARFCIGGVNSGSRCNEDTECPGSSCTGAGACVNDPGPFAGKGCSTSAQCGVCLLGSNAGNTCSLDSNCPGGSCQVHVCGTQKCIGGSNDGGTCSSTAHPATPDVDCPGGGLCETTGDCSSRCYGSDDVATTNCAKQSDCAEGERCRGICDSSNYCLKMRNGAPLPLSANGTSVCIDSQFFTNISGTRDIVTGTHEINYDLRSVTILANELNNRPCPVCGGFCPEGSPNNLEFERCNGTCTAGALECRFGQNKGDVCTTNADCNGDLCTGADCRFDSDCTAGTCSAAASPECAGAACRLDLACGGGPNNGKECRIEAFTAFGTTSADCPPDPGGDISTGGLAISWTPLTSAPVQLEQPGPCDSLGFENYDCNCVTHGGSTRNQPNDCQPACNAGANFGARCASFTTCVGGGAGIHGAGAACDEDSDCTSNDCSGNPKVCGTNSTGACSVKRCAGGANAGAVCALDGQCPGSTCPPVDCTVGGTPCLEGTCKPADCTSAAECDNGATCDDVCPSGICTPLCVQRGVCNGGDRDGGFCAEPEDCPGVGATCVPDDPEEGACAQGEFDHCDGPGWTHVECAPLNVNTMTGCGAGGDGILNDDPMTAADESADNSIGAGFCRADISNCFVNDGAAEGGSTLNGKGDPTNNLSVATFCIPASTSGAVNTTAGLPGPGRIRQPSVTVPNFTVLP